MSRREVRAPAEPGLPFALTNPDNRTFTARTQVADRRWTSFSGPARPIHYGDKPRSRTPHDSPAMTETDRTNVLHDLDARHDELLAELEALEREVQQAIAAIRPAANSAAAASTAGPSAQTC